MMTPLENQRCSGSCHHVGGHLGSDIYLLAESIGITAEGRRNLQASGGVVHNLVPPGSGGPLHSVMNNSETDISAQEFTPNNSQSDTH